MGVSPSGNDIQKKNGSTASKIQLVLKVVIYVVIMTAITFLVAGCWDWWMAWAYFAIYGLVMAVGVLIIPLDQELIGERTTIKKDVKRWDKILTGLLSPVYPFGIFILVGVEMRFGQALLFPLWAPIAGLMVSVIGQVSSNWALATDKFYGRFVRIQKDRGHYVVSDGPYHFIRHPGYIGVILTLLGTAFAIGSLWALIGSILASVVLIVRTALEDKVLQEELEGYTAYAKEIRYRLLPGIW